MLTIDGATGETTSTKPVESYASTGMTRMFEFNRNTNEFVTFENDFAKPAPRVVNMVTIAAQTGAMKTVTLDRVGFPTGYVVRRGAQADGSRDRPGSRRVGGQGRSFRPRQLLQRLSQRRYGAAERVRSRSATR